MNRLSELPKTAYEYTRLGDFLQQSHSNNSDASGKFVNHVLAVTTFCNPPRHKPPNQWIVTLGLTDDSLLDDQGIPISNAMPYMNRTNDQSSLSLPRVLVVIFADMEENLPKLRGTGGELLVLHRAKREVHNGCIQLCCTLKSRFGPSSWAVCEPADLVEHRKVLSNSSHFTLQDADWSRMKHLSEWFDSLLRRRLTNSTSANHAMPLTSLSDIVPLQFACSLSSTATHWVNLRVHVFGLLCSSELCAQLTADHVVLLATDGTPLPPQCPLKQAPSLMVASDESEFHLEALLRIYAWEQSSRQRHMAYIWLYDEWALEVVRRRQASPQTPFQPFTVVLNNVSVRKCSLHAQGTEPQTMCSLVMNGGQSHGRSLIWPPEPCPVPTTASSSSSVGLSEPTSSDCIASQFLEQVPPLPPFVSRVMHNRLGNVPTCCLARVLAVAQPKGRSRFHVTGLITALHPQPIPPRPEIVPQSTSRSHRNRSPLSTSSVQSNVRVTRSRAARQQQKQVERSTRGGAGGTSSSTTIRQHESTGSVLLRSLVSQCKLCKKFICPNEEDLSVPLGLLPMSMRAPVAHGLHPGIPGSSTREQEGELEESFVTAHSSLEECEHDVMEAEPVLGIQLTDFSGSLWLAVVGDEAVNELLAGIYSTLDGDIVEQPFSTLWDSGHLLGKPMRALTRCVHRMRDNGPWMHCIDTTLLSSD